MTGRHGAVLRAERKNGGETVKKNKRIPDPVVYRADEARERNVIGEKIIGLRRAEKISLRDFSEILQERGISVTAASINKWELGQTLPNAYQLLAVFDCFKVDDPGSYFSGNAVLNEEGLRKVAAYKEDLVASGLYAPDGEEADIIYVQMPVSLLSASAGTGDFLDDDCFEIRSFPRGSVPEGADFGVRVDGDSMTPKYEDGQIVWVRRTETLRPGEEGLFVLNGCGFIKLYREQTADSDVQGAVRNQPVLFSYNSAYEPITVGAEDSFRICGKILSL